MADRAPAARSLFFSWGRTRRVAGQSRPILPDVTGDRVRLQTIVLLRWLAVSGQTAAILIVEFGFGFALPLGWCLAAIAASAWLNILLSLRYTSATRLPDWQASAYFAFDVLQLAVLLYLTGGLENPFVLLVLAPVTISAATLSLRSTMLLVALAIVCVTALAFFHMPLPWFADEPVRLPFLYVAGIWVSLLLGIGFITAYARRITQESKRMSDALAATQLVLARGQRLSALDGLAAAAAHELGTPLGTIAVIAKELKRGGLSGPDAAEDVELLFSQAERCKEILSRLTQRPGEGDALHSQLLLSLLVEEVVRPHRDMDVAFDIDIAAEHANVPEPHFWRQPEILYGLGNFVENAADFAESEVRVTARYDAERIEIAIEDDGPGFTAEVLDRLGEPYVTTRPRNAVPDPEPEGHEGMGLGVFIAKTLLERTGAQVQIGNRPAPARGAAIVVTWPRAVVDAGRDLAAAE